MNNQSKPQTPKVSVFMMTYNHAPYIKQALDSVLSQKTSFSVEIVIGEDCSSDGTRDIVKSYAKQYPDRIKALLHEKNVGAKKNQMMVLEACTGEYIALLEGDDYWTDNDKLQKQIDFLDSHTDYAICAHNLEIVTPEGKSTGRNVNSETPFDTYTVTQLAGSNLLPTASCVYRNNFTAGPAPTGLPDWLLEANLGDYCLHMLAARFGKIKYLPEVMGAYRVHEGGAWSFQGVIARNIQLFDTIHLLKKAFSGETRNQLSKQQLFNLSEVADHGHVVPGFELNKFISDRKDAILELISDDFMPFMQSYFSQQRVVRSAEYKYGKRILKPARWLVEKMRRK